MPWEKGRKVEPEDIKEQRYLEACEKRCEEIRPQVEKLAEQVWALRRKAQ